MPGVKWEADTEVRGVYWRVGERGHKLFRHVFRDLNGKQVNCSKHTGIKATREHQREMRVNKPAPVVRLTLREAYDKRVADAAAMGEPYAKTTLDGHEAAWKHISHLANVQVGRITPKQVSDALKAVPGPQARVKVRHLLSMLGAPVPTDRKPNTRAAKLNRPKPRVHAITDAELARLVEEMPERYRALVKVMAYVGLRPGEAVSLTVGKLDPLARKLTVDTSLSGWTKTGEPRVLDLPASVVEMLTEHMATYCDSDPAAPMFPKDDGGAISTKNAYDAWRNRHFDPAAKRADVDVSPNSMRHFAAARAIAAGIDVIRVSKMLGHSRPSLTLDIYAYEFESREDDTAEKLDAVIRKAEATPATEAKVVRL